MDRGPFRTPQSTDRRATSRPEPANRPVEESQLRNDTHTAQRTTAPHFVAARKPSKAKRIIISIVGVLLVILLIVGGWFAWRMISGAASAPIDSGKYQAVFFTNGQVYFGKLQDYNSGYFKLTDIFYLQTQSTSSSESENPQETSTDQNNVQLIKLGEEIHGPEDTMIISKDQVLFYEDLKSDGKVARSIEQYKRR